MIVWKVDLHHSSAKGREQSKLSVFSPLFFFFLLVKNFRKVGTPPPPLTKIPGSVPVINKTSCDWYKFSLITEAAIFLTRNHLKYACLYTKMHQLKVYYVVNNNMYIHMYTG